MHIVALGARCAVGLTAPTAAAAIRAGISRIKEHPLLFDSTGESLHCASDPSIPPTKVGAERIALLGEHCLREIAAHLTQSQTYINEIPMLLALPEPRPGFSMADAHFVKNSLAAQRIPKMSSIRLQLVGQGHAGVLSALHAAVELISSRQHDLVILGGIDSYLDFRTVHWLDSQQRLARRGVRCGFPPGEGAAFLAVASDAACRRLALPPLAYVRDIAYSQELRNPESDEGLFGEGLTEAILGATRELCRSQELISDLFGDVNGERVRTEDWGFALMRMADRFRDGTDYVTSVGACGDVGAATGALGCVLAVQAWQRSYAKGPRALVWAGSWSGLRGAVVLEQEVQLRCPP